MRKQLAELHVELAENLRRLELGDCKKKETLSAHTIAKGGHLHITHFLSFARFISKNTVLTVCSLPRYAMVLKRPFPKNGALLSQKSTRKVHGLCFSPRSG